MTLSMQQLAVLATSTLVYILFSIPLSDDVFAKRDGKGDAKQSNLPYKYYEQKGLFLTNLKPLFPQNLSCPGVSSPYGSRTRYDGSTRKNPHYGFHNGMDITLKVGTELIAIANSKVIHKGTAGRLVGNYIWLHASPNETDLQAHAFIRYQHLNVPSNLDVGEKVSVGQKIGKAGKTGTTGGHFGKMGYPHLHIMYLLSETAKFRIQGSQIKLKNFYYLDPIAIYIANPGKKLSNHILRALPETEKTVNIPVKDNKGRMFPATSKVLWPVACTQR